MFCVAVVGQDPASCWVWTVVTGQELLFNHELKSVWYQQTDTLKLLTFYVSLGFDGCVCAASTSALEMEFTNQMNGKLFH